MRVLIAEHLPRVRFALRVTLERHPGLTSVGEVVDASELISQARALPPDLVLLDWELPGLNDGETLRTLRMACAQMLVLVLSSTDEGRRAALQAGADASVSRSESPDRLLAAISEYWTTERQHGESHHAT